MQNVNKFFFFLIIISLIIALLSLLIQTDLINKVLKKKIIKEIIFIDNKYMSKEFLMSKISTKEGQSFWLFNSFKLKKELKSFNEIEE